MQETAAAQSADTKASIAAATKSAEAAQKSADHIPVVERAYIFVTPTQPKILYDAGKSFAMVQLSVSNHGRTPGIIKTIYGEFAQYPPPGNIPLYENSEPSPGDYALAAGETETLPEVFRDSFLDPQFFWGYIEYIDIFKVTHTSRFCALIMPANVPGGGRLQMAGTDPWRDWN
jgi:hypothetical protein